MSQTVPLESGEKRGNTRVSSSKKWCFTFNNPVDRKNGSPDVLSKILGDLGLYVFQEERGKCGTDHYQGCVMFKKECRPIETVGIKDIHWEKCKNWNASLAYCTKSDTRVGQIYTNIEDLKIEEKIEIEEPYGWQLQVMDIIKTKPDKRTVYWFWNASGNIGKTTLAKYLCVKHGALYIGGNANDIKCAIASMKKKPTICILGVPKSVEHVSYRGLEEVKDGIFFSGKYESGMSVYNNPHVIVFANQEPELEMLSMDRWIVIEISK